MRVRFGRYELLRPLGSGGMAEVFLARYVGPEGFEKRLVIKRVLPRFSDDQRLLRMFFEEARTHVSLSHGNLVSVFDFGRVGNEYFIAMEHVPGADLALLLSASRSAGFVLRPSLVAYVGVELCRGLAYVHRRGFIHRDISPRNVLLSSDGEVKLSDFGLVLNSADDESPGVRGTIAFTSPEQARGDRVDARADLYSLGVVLAEAVTGQRQREAADDEEGLEIARAGRPIEIAGPLAAIIARATQTAPADRFADAGEMSIALEREAASFAESREASVRELATRISALQSVSSPEPAAPPVAGTAPTDAPTGPPNDPAARATADFRGQRPAIESPSSDAATYYRGNESASFVEEVLAPPAARSRAPIVWSALAALLVAGTLIGWGATRHTRATTPLRDAPPGVTSAKPAPASIPGTGMLGRATSATDLPSVAPDQIAPLTAPVNAPPQSATENVRAKSANVASRSGGPHVARAAAAGTLMIQCTPWCVPYVDGTVRGPDRKNHVLPLPAGRHHVEVRRLDDRLDRAVVIRPGQTESADFTFR